MRYQKVIRHGNALAVVIPAAICRELQIHRGDAVALEVLLRGLGWAGVSRFYLEITPVLEKYPVTETH